MNKGPTKRKAETKARRGVLLRRFRRNTSGATAIEFALVALPFFALMFAIIETFLTFFASQTIETAVNRGARLVRTGQAQTQSMNVEDFRDAICEGLAGMLACNANLKIDVRTYADFGNVDMSDPIDDEGNLDDEDFEFDPGDGGEIVVVRAFYEWPVFTNLLGLGLANLSNGKHLIAASTAFRNEPF